jgi:hypothetical protein
MLEQLLSILDAPFNECWMESGAARYHAQLYELAHGNYIGDPELPTLSAILDILGVEEPIDLEKLNTPGERPTGVSSLGLEIQTSIYGGVTAQVYAILFHPSEHFGGKAPYLTKPIRLN